MKKLLLLISLCAISFLVKSQDIIVKINGKEIKSKIIEANSDQIKYSLFNSTDNKIFTIHKKEIFMIEYENGKSDIYKDKIGDQNVINVSNFIDVNTNPEAYKLFRSGYKRYSLGRGLVGAGGGLFAFGVVALIVSYTDGVKDKTNIGASYIFISAGAAFLGAGLPLYFTAKKKMNTAFDMYKSNLKTSQNNYNMNLNMGMTQNGLGLTLRF